MKKRLALVEHQQALLAETCYPRMRHRVQSIVGTSPLADIP